MAAVQSIHPNKMIVPNTRTRVPAIETLQLVAPRKKMPVPNHLLDSKIYAKAGENSLVQARPAALHFTGFEIGQTQTEELQLANISSDVQRMHITPPQSKYFVLKYKKGERLVAGMTLDCTVEFTADECRYYYDCIRVHTKCEENIVIPIHAYPVLNTSEFPHYLEFPPVPIGHEASKSIPLRCRAPVDFEFNIRYLQPHPSMTVDPMAGIVPANEEVSVTVTFAPTEFSTAVMKLELLISQFNAKPLVCTFMGTSVPGLAKALTEKGSSTSNANTLDPRCITPLDRARKKKKSGKQKTRSSPTEYPPQEIEYQGIKFPINLDTPYAAAQVLSQEPGKLRIKDLRGAVMSKKSGTALQTRQMKEAVFEMAVRKDVHEERQNQLRWHVKLGSDLVTQEAKIKVFEDRTSAWENYSLMRGEPLEEDMYIRNCTKCTLRRTWRQCSEVPTDMAKFDTYQNDLWAVRHRVLRRFQQAGRIIILRNRAARSLRELRQTVLDWEAKKFAHTITAGKKEKQEEEAEALSLLNLVHLDVNRVSSITFPTYIQPDVKDDMAVDALGVVPFKPVDVVVKEKVAYANLKVPQQYKLMGYKAHSVHEASLNYVSRNLIRPLRTGAQDEIITLPAAAAAAPAVKLSADVGEFSLAEETMIKEAGDSRMTLSLVPDVQPVIPPAALFKPMDYPPMHIFNPAPGVQVFQTPLPYAETDHDFHLCPVPSYINKDNTTSNIFQKKPYLDKEDVIKGVMAWKRFPSQGLTSLANTATLTNVWVPRWADPFESDLLPHDVPELLDRLPEADQANVMEEHSDEEEENEEHLHLIPEMVNAQFPLVSAATTTDAKEREAGQSWRMPSNNLPVGPTGPVPRERREQELEFSLNKKYNRLGNKIQNRIDTLDTLNTNSNLLLK